MEPLFLITKIAWHVPGDYNTKVHYITFFHAAIINKIFFVTDIESQINFTHNKTPDGVTGTKGADYAEFASRQILIIQIKGDY